MLYPLTYPTPEIKTRNKSHCSFNISLDVFIIAAANKQIFRYGAVDPESMVWPDGYKHRDKSVIQDKWGFMAPVGNEWQISCSEH